jgi:crotonobetaine/carnitine-CoA ligase
VFVPVNTAFRGSFLHHVLFDAGTRVAIVDSEFVETVAKSGADLPQLELIVPVGPVAAQPEGFEVVGFDTLCEGVAAEPPRAEVHADTLACLLYTSGTTGPSKGCMLPHNYLVCLSEQISDCWDASDEDVVLTPLPLFHINALAVGAIGLLVRDFSVAVARRFSVSGFWPEVQRSNATIVSLLGSLATLLANAPDHSDSAEHKLRLCAAVPMPATTDEIWRQRFRCPTFSGGYGMTEVVLIATLLPGEPNRPGAAGRINSTIHDIRIVHDDCEVERGTIGEIVTRPLWPNVMFQGYWQRPEATVEVFRNLWFHTGDLARVDEADFLYFEDRKQDYLRRRGENISSFEVEQAILQHGDIADVAVHSVPSELGEDEVKVTAVLRDGVELDEATLSAWCTDRIPKFAWPRYIEFRTDLPRNAVGRVLKFQLRAEGVGADVWDREAVARSTL